MEPAQPAWVASPFAPASEAVSRPTNFATPTPSKWPAKGVPLNVIQRQLGHANLGITSVYLQGIRAAA